LVIVSQHKILGKGVFSTVNYETGKLISVTSGETYSPFDGNCNALRIDKETFWTNRNSNSLEFLNHSCNANSYFDILRSWGNKDKLFIPLISLGPIHPSEHITIDYDAYSWDMKVTKCSFTCKCGSKFCRKTIAGFRFLNPKQKIQMRYISPHVIKEQLRNL